jgi:hypothetical protein
VAPERPIGSGDGAVYAVGDCARGHDAPDRRSLHLGKVLEVGADQRQARTVRRIVDVGHALGKDLAALGLEGRHAALDLIAGGLGFGKADAGGLGLAAGLGEGRGSGGDFGRHSGSPERFSG